MVLVTGANQNHTVGKRSANRLNAEMRLDAGEAR